MRTTLTQKKQKAPRETIVTSISIPPALHQQAIKKAYGMRWGFATYVRDLIEKDLGIVRQ